MSAKSVQALPIGYGYNQGGLEFSELSSPDFRLYFDQRTPRDGKMALNSLNAAKPHMERWFRTSRGSPLIVNMSAESDNASFANFLTDSIELQTLGQGSRDLAWHEYTHETMYRQLDNFFGPAGAILHLPWMEAWFLEGLAEAISVSVGSEQQASVERYHALYNDWPTWDRIHSLYTSGPFSYRGYATSGAFVAWILRTYDANRLPEVLSKFRNDTMPWWWPWAFVPYNNFWPMDTMLKEWTGKSGHELYELYKQEATKHWLQSQSQPLLVGPTTKHVAITAANGVQLMNGKLTALTTSDGKVRLKTLTLDPGTNTAVAWEKTVSTIAAERDVWSSSVAVDGKTQTYVTEYWPIANKRRAAIVLREGDKKRTLKRTATWISNVWLSNTDVWWLESQLEQTRLCHVPRRSFQAKSVQCPLEKTVPQNLQFLGQETTRGTEHTSGIWLTSSTQTVLGDRHEIIAINTQNLNITKQPWSHGGRPLSIAFTTGGRWLLVADRSRRYIRRLNDLGQCQQSIPLSDLPLRLVNAAEEQPYVVTWLGESHAITGLPAQAQVQPCHPLDDHTSPLLVALRSGENPDLKSAIAASSIWQQADASVFATKDPAQDALDAVASSDGKTTVELSPQETRWRGRPVFAFPWIGADDALGPQLGMISVPLMDHMQNETVRATVLVGLYSRFPYQELALTENRWRPTWTLAAYRSQTYNGRYLDRTDDEIYTSYLDEKGGRIDGSLGQSWRDTSVAWEWGTRFGHLAPYIGSARHYGSFNEIYGAASLTWRMTERWRLHLSSQNKVAAKAMNENFDYNIVGGSIGFSRGIGKGMLDLGIEGERTRGPYRRDLQEMYTPLKTFVPGTGGGYNKNSYAFTADQGLFSPLFGDSQGRAKLNVNHPLIDDLDKFLGLVYVDRLDFSGFFNYGTAWYGDKLPERSAFVAAQGYNVDLLMDNKGVRFNCGGGIGQVLGRSWQLYMTAGFDAFF